MKRIVRRVLPHIAGSLCIAAVFFVMFLCIVFEAGETAQIERNDAAEELPAETEIGEPTLSTQPETPVVLYDVPLGCELQHYIVTLAKENGIDPAIIFGMIKRESNFKADAIGDGGDSEGLMQIQKKWHSKRMKELGCNDLLDPFQNVAVGIGKYEFIVNSGCCPVCQALSGKHFSVDKMMPGENAPPMHPHCRCSTAAWEDSAEYDAWLDHLANGGTTEEWNALNRSRTHSRGLSAKISGVGIPEHDAPELLKTIDYNDKAAVMAEIEAFEKSARSLPIETACVITRSGKVYRCFGVEDRVFPDFDLKDEIEGATISHNHPIKDTQYTFSSDDIWLYMKYNLDVLRGCDEVYTYQLTRNAADIDSIEDIDIDDMTEEAFFHFDAIRRATQNEIGYRRWKND